MHKQKIEIEVDMPDGYEFAAFRAPVLGEEFLSAISLDLITCVVEYDPTFKTIIVRKKWTPPAWLPEGCWLYRLHTSWYVTTLEPIPCYHAPDGYANRSTTARSVNAGSLAKLHNEPFTPPPVDCIQITHETATV